jgi:hypothetical protein
VGFLAVLLFLLAPTLARLTGALFQLSFGRGSGFLSLLCDFVGSFPGFEGSRAPVLFLSFTLSTSMLFARV